MAIIDIRGGHGSGKSWIVHQLIKRYGGEEIVESGRTIGHYLPSFDAGIVGRYATTCGGADQVGSADKVVALIRRFSLGYTHVIVESVLVSHTFKRYAELANELGDYHFCFLDTPEEKCIARVLARRKARSNYKPFNPRNVIKEHRSSWELTKKSLKDDGQSVIILNYRNPLPRIKSLLRK